MGIVRQQTKRPSGIAPAQGRSALHLLPSVTIPIQHTTSLTKRSIALARLSKFIPYVH
jgi:hypothetical protein